jgi:hypothetical protein
VTYLSVLIVRAWWEQLVKQFKMELGTKTEESFLPFLDSIRNIHRRLSVDVEESDFSNPDEYLVYGLQPLLALATGKGLFNIWGAKGGGCDGGGAVTARALPQKVSMFPCVIGSYSLEGLYRCNRDC